MNSGTSMLLNDIASAWSSWMFGMTWLVAVLVAVLALISTVLRGRSASLLYTLWLLVLIRLVLPPDFAFPTGWGWWVRAEPTAVASSAAQPVTLPQPESVNTPGSVPAAPSTVQPDSPASTSVPVGMILMIAWLGIVAARCGMLFTAALQVRVWVSRARPILDPAMCELLEECRTRVGVRRRVELRNSEACSTPLVVGIWRPVLLLPSAVLERLSVEQLRSVLIHELHHVRRWDSLVNLLQGLLGAVYFFHPAVWWANRQLRQLREDACDERTVAVLEGNRKPYGEAIFRVAEILGYSAPPLTLGVLDSTSPLTQRLKRILDPRLPLDGGQPWKSTLILIVAVAVLLPAGARPAASVADLPSERRIVAEAFSDNPLASVKKHRTPGSRREIPLPEEPSSTEEPSPDESAQTEKPAPPEESAPPTPVEPPPAESSQDSTADQPAIADPDMADLLRDLSVADRRATAIVSLIVMGSSVESELFRLLPEADQATRLAIYEILGRVGSERSLLPLQQALQMRNHSEEAPIRQALDAVYGRMVVPASRREPSVNSSRIYEQDEQDDWDSPY